MPFEEFLGNSHCVEIVRRGLRNDRIPHALLFAGPDAVGKRLLAKHLALSLNCLDSERDNWCGHCSHCSQIEFGSHPDVLIVNPDGQFIKIEQVRHLIREASFEPFSGRFRVIILDEAHRLHLTAANALLKILEEPPPRSRLILITSKPHSLLVTVRSRCQVILFSTLTASEIEQVLSAQPNMNSEEVSRRAKLSEGSAGRALELDLESYDSLSKKATLFLDLAFVGGSLDDVSGLVVKVGQERKSTEEWLQIVLRQLRAHVVGEVTGQFAVHRISLPQLGLMVRHVEELLHRLGHNINRPMALESLFLKFSDIARHKT